MGVSAAIKVVDKIEGENWARFHKTPASVPYEWVGVGVCVCVYK